MNDDTQVLENWKAAGLIAGRACGRELRKLAGAVVEAEKGVLKNLKPLGMAALQSAIGATVGTIVGKNVGKGGGHDSSRADKNIATAAPQIFRAGFDEGMRHGLTESEIKKGIK